MNVFDYFFVCGIPKEIDKVNVLRHNENSQYLEGCFHVYPALQDHYPKTLERNRWDRSIENTLTQLCHPAGLLISIGKYSESRKFHSFVITREDGFRTYGHVLSFFLPVEDGEAKLKLQCCFNSGAIEEGQEILVQRSICLISRFAYINIAEKVLCQLYDACSQELSNHSYPVESYLYNILFHLPIPSPGSSLALIWKKEDPIIIQQPSSMELPLMDIHLSSLFSLLGSAENVLKLLTSVFLEHQILIISRDCSKLIVIGESVRALMFPFQWPHTYSPVLPYKLAHDFVYAPVPYIMGIPMVSDKTFDLNFDQCFVDVDNNIVQCPEDQPIFPNQISLVIQLKKIYLKYKQQISQATQKKSIDNESIDESTKILWEEDSVKESPPIQRRNAQKRLSKVLQEEEEDDTAANMAANDENVEELKNLHASGIPMETEKTVIEEADLKRIKVDEIELVEQNFNVHVRETILGSLVSLFSQYDKFVIHPDGIGQESGETWFLNREIQQNFDKASFLSDQAEYHLQFLSTFLETQAFASLIDNRIVADLKIGNMDYNLRVFDDRIKQAKSMPRTAIAGAQMSTAMNEPSSMDFLSRSVSIISAGQSAKLNIEAWIKRSESSLKRRFTNVGGRYPKLKKFLPCDGEKEKSKYAAIFPNITRPSLLESSGKECEVKLQSSRSDSDWHQVQQTKKGLMRQLSTSEFSPDLVAQTNWKFLAKLLKDVKLKTKKLLVRKMGHEAIELGHTETNIKGLEENTLIGSLCDLLERIWGHGLHANHKKGKSALWSHLLMYQQDETRIQQMPKHDILKTVGSSHLVSLSHHKSMPSISEKSTRLSPQPARKNTDDNFLNRKLSQHAISPNDGRFILPISTDIISNIKRIQQLREVQTDVGKCRAWIRLTLERKQLHMHLKKLLSNRPLLQTLYKKFSLLRCDDEREQFLYHLLSLNAVDFSCFTNSFTKTFITYHVWIYPKRQLSGISQTSANVYILVSGELNCTSKISVPKGCLDFSFDHQNLGVLTSMILGHDNLGLLPKWLVDFVLIRNEMTGQAYFFPSGRWLGKNVDDGGTQRLLLAQIVPLQKDLNQFTHEVMNGKTSYAFSMLPKKSNSIQTVQENVGQAVNAIVKHFHQVSGERAGTSALTFLLCRPNGLIPSLMHLFQNGLKYAGFFRKQVSAWDAITDICQAISGGSTVAKQEQSVYKSTLNNIGDMLKNAALSRNSSFAESGSDSTSYSQSSLQQTARDDGEIETFDEKYKNDVERLLNVHSIIMSQDDAGLGKDYMFQLFICIGLKEHCLSNWLKCISKIAKSRIQMYDKSAFLCNSQAVSFTAQVLNSLSEYKFQIEPIVMRGLENLLNEPFFSA